MPVSVTNANLVVKDKNGNTGVVKTLTAADVTKLNNAISDVAVVVDPTTHVARPATTSSTGVVLLADAAAISAGTPGRVVDAAQLQAASSAISVDSTYAEPAARTGIISSASDLLTAPGGSTPVTKDYVDLTSAQTVGGVKTFTALPRASTVPTADDQLVNKKYVDDTGANHVTLDTAQTITGAKTVTKTVTYDADSTQPGYVEGLSINRGTFDASTAPEADVNTAMVILKDKNGATMNTLQAANTAAGAVATAITARKIVDGASRTSSLTVGIEADGTIYNRVPNPAAGDDSMNIATTHFVQGELASKVISTLYVDGSSGSDTNDGKTAETAFKTIGKAMTIAHAYCSSRYDGAIIVQVAGGTYAENVGVSGPEFIQLTITGNVTVNSLTCSHTSYCAVTSSGQHTFTSLGNIKAGQNSMLTLGGSLTHIYATQITADDNSEIRVDTTPVTVNGGSGVAACSVYRSRALFSCPVEIVGNSSSALIDVSGGSSLQFTQAVSVSGSCTTGIHVYLGSLLFCANSSSTYLDYTATTSGNAFYISDNSAAIFNGSGTYNLYIHAAVTGNVISCQNNSNISRLGGSAPIVIENTATGRTAQDITIGCSSNLNINDLSLTTVTTSNCLNVYSGASARVVNLTINNSSSSAAVSVYVSMSSSLEITGSVSLTRATTATSEGFLAATLKSSLYLFGSGSFTVNGGCNAVVVANSGAFVGFRGSGRYTVSGTVTGGRAYSVGALALFDARGHIMPSASGTTPYVDTAHFGVAY